MIDQGNRFARPGLLGWTTVIRPRNTRSLNCRSEQLGPRFSINVRSWLASRPSRDAGRRQSSARIPTCTYLRACKRWTHLCAFPAWISTARARAHARTSLSAWLYVRGTCVRKGELYAYACVFVLERGERGSVCWKLATWRFWENSVAKLIS